MRKVTQWLYGKSNIIKPIASYIIAVPAGIISFFLALNLRVIVLMIVQTITAANISMRWSYSFINALSVIILMLCWIVYVFFIQHYFEKKCYDKASYIRGLLVCVLPMVVLHLAIEVFFWVIEHV